MVTVRAGAIEFVYRFVNEIRPTSAAILTSVPLATDQLHGTIFATVLRFAGTGVIGSPVCANTVLAWCVSLALVDVVLTMITLVSIVTFAGVTANAVYAASGLARVAVALVDVHLAIFPGHTLHAQTFVSKNKEDIEVQL